MSGIEIRDGVLIVEREPNQLDELAGTFSRYLEQFDIGHVYVSGYVSILAGRARSTEDIDVLIEPTESETIAGLVATLETKDFWGPAMPLSRMYEMLEAGDNIWIAPREQVTPHLEVKFARDEFDRASLQNALEARIGEFEIPIGPIELQIAYKLFLGSRTDIEDAVHLYTYFEQSLSTNRLEQWVGRLEVQDEYDRLEGA